MSQSGDKRWDPRYPLRLLVVLKGRRDDEQALTDNIARRGLFVRTDDPRPVRHLVRVRMTLPPDDQEVEVLAVVAHRVLPGEANEGTHPPGMGLHFYKLPTGMQRRWEQLVERVAREHIAKRTDSVPEEPLAPDEPSFGVEGPGDGPPPQVPAGPWAGYAPAPWGRSGEPTPIWHPASQPGLPTTPDVLTRTDTKAPPASARAHTAHARTPPPWRPDQAPGQPPPPATAPSAGQRPPPPPAAALSAGQRPPPQRQQQPEEAEERRVDTIRRLHPRHRAVFRVELRSMERLHRLLSRDISVGGIFVGAQTLIGLGELVKLEIVHPMSGHKFPVEGKVVRVVSEPPEERGMGVQFRGLDEGRKIMLTEFVFSGLPPEPPHEIVMIDLDDPNLVL